ncbi:PAN domain-containing protein At5g03700 [Cajanus cajan]|uniref:PAN domain-containing protein At5g03700 family n=1 Tax=Cajanus cajan TaxID=3821 RepID=A0A151TV23_CAJCA|nr:PAN domain-containing protein At5g03700 [Cajanus cajan]KYP70922.1 PAN domain-containing protein At5g03700 family [Cajanus cajan]
MLGTHHLHLIAILFLLPCSCSSASSYIPQELHKGFTASPESSTASFQAVLSDPSGNFSLGFLRVNQNHLALAILHVASSEPFWLANPTHAASWSHTTRLSFNGSLVLTDPETRVWWSTATNGDRALLLNNSNLQIQTRAQGTPLWESFNFPTNTLVQGQNFTSHMTLLSLPPNAFYSLRLGDNFMGLYENRHFLYWKHTALETKAEIKEGQGPIYARVNSEGYLGMYQTNDKLPADVQKFNSFQQPVTAASFLLVRLEPDGNLRGYYWDGSNWLLNYQAITETCDLPRPCGSYGLCTPGGSGCSCLDNRTRFEPGGCFNHVSGDLCGGRKSYRVVRRSGVEPPHKELVSHVTTSSLAECELLCQNNCSCWGALYSNSTGFCYVLDYPIQTMLGSGDGSKVGYFKVTKEERGKMNRVWVVVTVLVVVGIVIIGGAVCMTRWKKRNGVKEDDWASPGPYKNLGSASFRSIEMSSNGK